ncbi:MAG: ATP-binding protein [Thiobacillus sp.]|nr:ATP-binding protein [Thiobacillus sp.]
MATNSTLEIHADDAELVDRIRQSQNSENFVSTTLRTDERVIARVTDGIYRQPASAIRELISNAYDADATRVVVNTDAPRFNRISVEDNGHGMSPEVLAHLLFHIGGSAKRSDVGKELGVTSQLDASKSPGGRKLIGKIGIGLFSVSQLTHTFQIITKIKGDAYRTIATVVLKQYIDEEVASKEPGGKKQFESGKVNIWREKAADMDAQGTTVVLTSIRPQARDTLRSREIWAAIAHSEKSLDPDERQSIEPPRFHIGRVDDETGELLQKTSGKYSALPWDAADGHAEAFKKLVQSVWDEVEQSNPNPQLDRIFDYYLRMVWQLSLAVPLPYVDGHIFDMPQAEWVDIFELANTPKGSARRIVPEEGKAIRDAMTLVDPVEKVGQFDVYFDNLKLSRPIKFRGLPKSSNALKKPLVFLGKCTERFEKLPRELSGGSLAFEAYLFWTPKIAPTEHQGALVRIHGSSGTLFDPTFMRYQVSEQTRLRQITCEIFVNEGLDSALNIDRESFNNAHPHAVYITKWLHSALRQLATAQKRLAGEVRVHAREENKDVAVSEIQRLAVDLWKQETDDPASQPPAIEISDTGQKSSASMAEAYVFSRAQVMPERPRVKTNKTRARDAILEEKLKAIAQVLASFGLLDSVPKRKQEKLLKAIFEILEASEN